MPPLTRALALQFATILSSGVPSLEAIRYFIPEDSPIHHDPTLIRQLHDKWISGKLMQEAVATVAGKAWQNMSLDERIKLSVDKHYTEMAYFLYAHNYAELEGAQRLKADTCRDALEKRLAGTAGQRDALSTFLADVKNGVVTLGRPKAPASLSTH